MQKQRHRMRQKPLRNWEEGIPEKAPGKGIPLVEHEIQSIKKSIQTLDDDITREKGIIIDANSNEKRLKEEKTELIETDSKYFETEKLSNEELEDAKNKLRDEQKAVAVARS